MSPRTSRAFLTTVAALACCAPHWSCTDLSELRETFTNPCGSGGCAVTPQDCSTLASLEWAVDGYLTAPEAQVSVGSSYRASLAPAIEPQCQPHVRGVTWQTDQPAIVSIAPQDTFVWISGRMEGVASVGARITFSDGSAREARPRIVRVVAPAAPLAGQLVTEGRLTIPPLAPGSAAWHGWVPFTTSAAGRVSVRVDWESPLNRMDCSGYEGHCDAIGRCGMIRMTCNTVKDKPITASFDSPATPAGPYTIRIDNLGPGEEAVRYEVRLTPR